MNKFLIYAFLCLLFSATTLASEYLSYEMPNTQVIPLKDTQTNKQYELYIKLPDDYGVSESEEYSVIYFTDAVWHIDVLSAATAFLLEDVILVGISWQKNSEQALVQEYGEHVSRFTDYSFWTKSNPDHPKLVFGQANNHLQFIRSQVIPFVENNFLTNASNTYFGYSLGGLFGAHTLLTQPDTFDNYILGSPSVQLLSQEDSQIKTSTRMIKANILLTNGSEEVERGEHIQSFIAKLQGKQNKALNVEHIVIDGDHQSAFPETAIESIKWLSRSHP